MGRNRYWVTGAIAAILTLLWSLIFPLVSPHASPGATHPGMAPVLAQSALPPEITQPLSPDDLLGQGILAYQQGQFTAAVETFEQVAAAYRNKPASLDLAQALSYLSLAQQQQGDWTGAAQSISQSLGLAGQAEISREQQLILGRALNSQGSLYFSQGKTTEALAAWQQAEKAYAQAQDETRQLGSLINQSQALQSLGFHRRAKRTLEDIRQRLENQPASLQLIGLQNLGTAFWRIGDLDQAEQILLQALRLATSANLPAQQSAILLSLANVEQSQTATGQALQHYQEAAKQGSPSISFQANLNQFRLLLSLAKPQQAQDLIPALSAQLGSLPPSRSLLYGATNFADGLIQIAFGLQPNSSVRAQSFNQQTSGIPDSDTKAAIKDLAAARLASETLSWAIAAAQEIGDARAETYGKGYLAHIHELSGQWAPAQALTQKALNQAESIHAGDISYQWHWQLARIFKAEGNLTAATAAYQNAYATLQSLRSDLVSAQPDLQSSFRGKIEPIYREWVELLLRPEAGSAQPSQAALKQAREVLESLQIAELNDFFKTSCLQDQAVPLEAIDRKGTAILYPVILPDRLTVILSLPGQALLHSYSTEISQTQVKTDLQKLRATLEQPYTNPEGKQLGQRIYQWLISPIEAELSSQGIKTLTFVLEGVLRNVPMAALYDGQQYLIENYSIALAPGLKLLDPEHLELQRKPTLIAGITEARDNFSALSYVAQEVKAVQDLVPNKLLINQDFTRTALEKNLQSADFPVVHLATHGRFSSKAADTFIVTWNEQVNVTELGAALRGRDRPDPIELLVLSACETASSDDELAALGLAGFAVQAGARSTLASLWSQDDQSGARFAKQFYQALSTGKLSRAEALQQAQIDLLKDPQYRHPRHWAPYVLLGNWL